jgi:hypothetical protein
MTLILFHSQKKEYYQLKKRGKKSSVGSKPYRSFLLYGKESPFFT